MASAAVDKRIESYRRLHIYGTKSRLYVVGHDEQLGTCRILKFRRQDGSRLDVVEDPLVYTPDQCNLVLRKVHEQSGGLQLICKVSRCRFCNSRAAACCSAACLQLITSVLQLIIVPQ